jgi:hypothetical protein
MNVESQINNRGKTLIYNIDKVANSINFPPEWLMIYFGTVMDCQYSYATISILTKTITSNELDEHVNILKESLGVCNKCHKNNSEYITTKKCLAVICKECNVPRNIYGLSEKFCQSIMNDNKISIRPENYLSLIL